MPLQRPWSFARTTSSRRSRRNTRAVWPPTPRISARPSAPLDDQTLERRRRHRHVGRKPARSIALLFWGMRRARLIPLVLLLAVSRSVAAQWQASVDVGVSRLEQTGI